jgi:3-oxoacyl-[acyl-carrier-protein] synthase III
MRLVTVNHAVPSRTVTNDAVRDGLRESNRARFSADELALMDRRVGHLFEAAGTRTRYRVNNGERAIDFALKAGREALEGAGVSPGDVDFVIWAGVGRGWIEPSMASVVQWQLGLVNATCFDVVDACASWLRALHVAHTFLRSGTYRRGLIVNCECGFPMYDDFTLQRIEDLDHRAAAWTIGEAATATIVDDQQADDDYYFVFRNYGDDFHLCVFPIAPFEQFWVGAPDPRYAPMRLFVQSSELLTAAARRLVDVFSLDPRLRNVTFDVGFGHEASVKVNRILAAKLGLPYQRYVSTHADFGNTVSATVPLGMSLALHDGRLKRGDRVLVLVGASGVTVGVLTFTF